MTVLFTDNFNRADSGSLGANWSPYFSTATILSNQAKFTSGGTNQNPDECINSGVGSSGIIADAKATITLVGPFDVNQIGGLSGRHAASTDTYYTWELYADGGWELYKKVGGGYTLLLNDGGAKLTLSTTAPARLEISGAITVTLAMYYNGTLVTTKTDSAITVAGLYGFFSFVDNKIFDDWQIEDFAGAATIPPGLGPVVGAVLPFMNDSSLLR